MDLGSSSESMPVERRRLLTRLIGASAVIVAGITLAPGIGLLLAPILSAGSRSRRKLVFANPADAGSTTFVTARYEDEPETDPAIYFRLADGKPVALSARCTHAGCTVLWRAEQDAFVCPCHGGRFDSSGKNVSGPPPRPLDNLQATSQDGAIYVEAPAA